LQKHGEHQLVGYPHPFGIFVKEATYRFPSEEGHNR